MLLKNAQTVKMSIKVVKFFYDYIRKYHNFQQKSADSEAFSSSGQRRQCPQAGHANLPNRKSPPVLLLTKPGGLPYEG